MPQNQYYVTNDKDKREERSESIEPKRVEIKSKSSAIYSKILPPQPEPKLRRNQVNSFLER